MNLFAQLPEEQRAAIKPACLLGREKWREYFIAEPWEQLAGKKKEEIPMCYDRIDLYTLNINITNIARCLASKTESPTLLLPRSYNWHTVAIQIIGLLSSGVKKTKAIPRTSFLCPTYHQREASSGA